MNIGWSQPEKRRSLVDHNHDHDEHAPIEDATEMSHYEKRTRAIQSLLVEKGVMAADEVRRQVENMDSRTPAQGTRVIARAWVDEAFKARLLANANAAIGELRIEAGSDPVIAAVENTREVHNVIVCTLCSCYPRALLGFPPAWYKSLNYRSRMVEEPRAVLGEFGLELDEEVEVRVYDSTADMRYLVIPERPPGTEQMGEEELADLVTRDSMIGVAVAHGPDLKTSHA